MAISFKENVGIVKRKSGKTHSTFFGFRIRIFSLFPLTPFHQVLLWYPTAVSRRAIVYCRRLPVRPSGNNPQSLYSGLRELQVDSPSPHPNNLGWTKKGKQILGCIYVNPGKKDTNYFFSELLGKSENDGWPLRGLRKKQWTPMDWARRWLYLLIIW